MSSVGIELLSSLRASDVERLISGYESRQRYKVQHFEAPGRIGFDLELVDLDGPFMKTWESARYIDRYRRLLGKNLSFGAYVDDRLVGLAIVEHSGWNETADVWELHVEASHRKRGIGRDLLAHVERASRRAGLRIVACETQTTNVGAIGFYRSCGYSLHGIDLSHYANDDVERGEVAVFMKKMLETRS